jgi:hypothetical protein
LTLHIGKAYIPDFRASHCFTFEDELELYEMIDMDAPGEIVDDEGIDSSTGDILLS